MEETSSPAALSAPVTAHLRDALELHALRGGTRELASALKATCAEAYARHVPPEAIVVALRHAWAQVQQPDGMEDHAWARAYFAALCLCLATYHT